ncbi:Bud site selection protein, Revert to axial protein 1, partial [Entomortierella beljakovae]
MSEANSLDTSSSLSAISSATSRKQPPPHLEAIQTQKAQANTKFRPVSKVITGFIPPYTQDQLDELGLETPGSGKGATYPDPPMSALTSTTVMGSVPFTPTTLVGGLHSPLEHHPEYPTQQHPAAAFVRNSGSISRRHQDAGFSGNGTAITATNRASTSSNHRHSRVTNNGGGSSSTSGNNNNNKNRYSASKQGGMSGIDFPYSIPPPPLSEGNLPTLWQVLHRKTLPPVCLYNFYLYMRDSEKSSEELDFWLDVTAHEILWKIYVRANKRRQAMAAQEKAERDEKLALVAASNAAAAEEEAARLEEEKWRALQQQEGEAEGTSKQRISINLAMYEPHWSTANRYLEMAEGATTTATAAAAATAGSDDTPDYSPTTDVDMNYKKLRHKSSDLTQFESIKEVESPSIQSLDSTIRHVPNLPGAVPSNWKRVSDGYETGVGPQQQQQQQSINKSTVDSLVTKKDGMDGTGATTVVQRSGTMAKSTTLKRGLTSGTSSVTREDLQKSAEQIYYKYLIPQAEKPIRVPGSVKQRVASIMDSTLMSNNSGATPFKVTSLGNENTSKSKDEITSENDNNNASSMASLSSPKDEKEKSRQTNPRGSLGDSIQKQGLRQSTISQSSGPHLDQDLGLVFAEAREVVFEGMESYYFPRFLRARAYGNMGRSHCIARAILGLFILFIGFVIALCMIFLNLRPRSLRAWFNICPFMVAFEVSETTWMQFAKIKEPYILTLHRKRAVK